MTGTPAPPVAAAAAGLGPGDERAGSGGRGRLLGGLLLIDLAFLLAELAAVLRLGQGLFPVLAGLWPAVGVLFAVGGLLWIPASLRLRAPLSPEALPHAAGRRRARERVLYRSATRMALDSLWLRGALVTALCAMLGFYGVRHHGLPREGAAFLLWTAALVTPLIDAWRALLDERAARRLVERLAATRLSLRIPSLSPGELARYLLDSHQSRLLLTSLALLGLALALATLSLCLSLPLLAAYVAVAGPGLLPSLTRMLFWAPPVGIALVVAGIVGLRRMARPIERFNRTAGGPSASYEPTGPLLDGPALVAAESLPGLMVLGKLVLFSLGLLVLGAVAVFVWRAPPRVVSLLAGQVMLGVLATTSLEWPWLTLLLSPLVPPGRRGRRTLGTAALLAGSAVLPHLLFIGLLLLLRSLLGSLLLSQPGAPRSLRLLVDALLLVAFVVLSLLSLGRWLGRRLRPLQLLTAGAQRLARGTAEAPPLLPPTGDPELGRLHQSLVAMQDVLAERLLSSAQAQARLEAEVAARTTELRRRNDELVQAMRLLSEAQGELSHAEKMASVGRFVAGIAHEINNPINAVVNTAHPLRQGLADLAAALAGGSPAALEELPELRSMLRVLDRGARRAAEIVEALGRYSQGGDHAPTRVDVHRVLDEALELLQHPFKASVEIERRYEARRPVHSRGGELQQVFVNLFSNAVHALGERAASDPGPRPRLVLGTVEDPERGELRIAVTDNGPGIPASVLPRIFDPFFTTKDATLGSGLGLSIVHGIVARHGGQIHVDTEPGRGTCFTVVLPLLDEPSR